MATIPKIIAFYLPQFHPIAENNSWWGPGFTEWHNVARARPLFRGHRQPNLPGELGFYDLRLGQTRLDQAKLAKHYGIFGFCYWHYWFAGKRLLETPLEEVLRTGEPDFPFCLAWANESWTGVWHGSPSKVLMEQTYPEGDAARHYNVLRRFFHDDRYIKRDGKPVLYIYKPKHLQEAADYLKSLRKLAYSDGFPGLYVIGTWSPNPGGQFRSIDEVDLDAAVVVNITGRDSFTSMQLFQAAFEKFKGKLRIPLGPKKIPYSKVLYSMVPDLRDFPFPAYNCVISNWDNTPRSGRRGLVLTGSGPDLFRKALELAFTNLQVLPNDDGRYLFLKSWNEWAEGNYVEPDQIYGREFLEAIADTYAHLGLTP